MSKGLTSEMYYGVSPQPPDTCPMIDRGLEGLKNMTKNNPRDSLIRRADEDELRGMLEEVSYTNGYYYGDVEQAFEEVRNNASKLRAWGQEWKELAKESTEKVESIQTLWGAVEFWWYEIGFDNLRATWLYKTCWQPRFERKIDRVY